MTTEVSDIAAMWRSTSMARRLCSGLVLVAASGLLLSGCGGDQLDADSSCEDYLKASPADQDQAVQDVAADVGAANAVTPLGRPNIDFLCVQAPDMTLGEAVERTG
jgi:hypothetical protein